MIEVTSLSHKPTTKYLYHFYYMQLWYTTLIFMKKKKVKIFVS